MATRLTETMLRQIIREEVTNLREGEFRFTGQYRTPARLRGPAGSRRRANQPLIQPPPGGVSPRGPFFSYAGGKHTWDELLAELEEFVRSTPDPLAGDEDPLGAAQEIVHEFLVNSGLYQRCSEEWVAEAEELVSSLLA